MAADAAVAGALETDFWSRRVVWVSVCGGGGGDCQLVMPPEGASQVIVVFDEQTAQQTRTQQFVCL